MVLKCYPTEGLKVKEILGHELVMVLKSYSTEGLKVSGPGS